MIETVSQNLRKFKNNYATQHACGGSELNIILYIFKNVIFLIFSHFFQKCRHFHGLCFDFRGNDNTFERNEDCATVFLKSTDFRKVIECQEVAIIMGTIILV